MSRWTRWSSIRSRTPATISIGPRRSTRATNRQPDVGKGTSVQLHGQPRHRQVAQPRTQQVGQPASRDGSHTGFRRACPDLSADLRKLTSCSWSSACSPPPPYSACSPSLSPDERATGKADDGPPKQRAARTDLTEPKPLQSTRLAGAITPRGTGALQSSGPSRTTSTQRP